MAGKADSFRRSKRVQQRQNGLTEPMEALRRFHSFQRSREMAGKRDSFRRSAEKLYDEMSCDLGDIFADSH